MLETLILASDEQTSSPIPHSTVSAGKNTQTTETIWAVSVRLVVKTERESATSCICVLFR